MIICKSIINSDVVLGIFLSKFAGCPWLNQQLGYAEAREKPIILLSQTNAHLNPFLTNKPKVQFNGQDLDNVIKNTIVMIKENMGVSLRKD